jgi:hypothetical protein
MIHSIDGNCKHTFFSQSGLSVTDSIICIMRSSRTVNVYLTAQLSSSSIKTQDQQVRLLPAIPILDIGMIQRISKHRISPVALHHIGQSINACQFLFFSKILIRTSGLYVRGKFHPGSSKGVVCLGMIVGRRGGCLLVLATEREDSLGITKPLESEIEGKAPKLYRINKRSAMAEEIQAGAGCDQAAPLDHVPGTARQALAFFRLQGSELSNDGRLAGQ